MSLYETWIRSAYDQNGKANNKLWDSYMPKEKEIYANIIEGKTSNITGTVKQLSERFDLPKEQVCGFIDGINEAIDQPVDVENLEEDTEITLDIDFVKLYKKMVEYKAEHLYTLPQWNGIFTEEEQKTMFTEQKKSKTFVRDSGKVGRNDPCPCGSGLKHKKCCGK